MLRPALGIVHRHARVLLVDHALQGLFQRNIAGQGEDVGTRHHDLAHQNVLQIEGVMNHLLLRPPQNSQPAAGGDDQLQLFRRLHPDLAHLVGAENFQNRLAGGGHEAQKRRGDGHEDVHRSGDQERNLFGALQGDGLGNDFAQNHDQVGDDDEGRGDGDTMGVERRVRQRSKQRLQHVGQRGFTEPAQSQAGDGHAELHCAEDVVEFLMKLLNGARANAVRCDHLLNSGFADTDQRELGSHKESIGCDQQNHHHDAQQGKSNH